MKLTDSACSSAERQAMGTGIPESAIAEDGRASSADTREAPDWAWRYLRDNASLRRAVGARADALLEPRWLGEGEHNLNFTFCEPASARRYVLRVNVAAQPFHDDQVAYEYAALNVLSSSGRTPQPVYLDNSSSAPEKGVLVISFCDGEELDFDHLRPGDLRCAAQLMADIHAVPVPQACKLFRPKDPLRALFDECVERFRIYRMSSFENARLTRKVELFISTAQTTLDRVALAPSDCRHIVNTETLPSHFLIPEASARVAALAAGDEGRFCENPGSFVDWERPIIGEVAQDLAYFTSPTTTFWDSEYLFAASEVDLFLHDYWRAVDGRFDRGGFDGRFQAWRMMTALRSTTWCCKALLSYGRLDPKGQLLAASDEGSTHTTNKTARKLPVYLSDEFMALVASECFAL